MTTDLTPDGLMSVREAANMVRLTEQSIRKAINNGSLPVYYVLGLQAVRWADVKALWPKRVDKG